MVAEERRAATRGRAWMEGRNGRSNATKCNREGGLIGGGTGARGASPRGVERDGEELPFRFCCKGSLR